MTTLSSAVINAGARAGTVVRQFETLSGLKAATPLTGETVILENRASNNDGGDGVFDWDGGDLSALVTIDTQSAIYVAPNSDTTGASGAWVRRHYGEIRAEWAGAVGDGTTDDTTAIRATDELLRTQNDIHVWRVSKTHLTDSFGNLGSAAISSSGMNGKWIKGTAAKRSGFKLKPSSLAATRLFAASFQEGGVENIRFDGDNPSSEWGAGSANNPNTDLLLEISGYGITWRDNDVRFSGGDGVRFRGDVGVVEIEGGQNSFKYNVGYGLVFDRISGVRGNIIWTEGNTAGGILFNNDFLAADGDVNTSKPFWRESNIEIDQIYDENGTANAVAVEIRGGHLGIRIGSITSWGATNKTLFHLKENTNSDNIWQGAHGCTIRIGSGTKGKILIDSKCYGNTFIRQAGLPTTTEYPLIDWRDSGDNNQMVWESPDPRHVLPSASTGTIYGTTSNFAASASSQPAVLTATAGGILGTSEDHDATLGGPARLVADGFNSGESEAEMNFTHALNASISGSQTYYLVLSMKAEAHQRIAIGIYDSTNTVWYQPDSAAFAASDDFGPYQVIRADRHQRYFIIPFANNGVTRNIRVQVRGYGAGVAEFYHCYVTDKPIAAPVAIISGSRVRDLTADGDLSVSGDVTFSGLPTSNPASAGVLWNDAGTLKVSAG